MWNVKNLKGPPVHTFKSTSFIDVKKFDIFREAIELLNNQQHLEAEAALLSRCIYRMKMKFRTDKGFKSMEKLNRALRQYLYVNFANVVTNFYDLIPTKISIGVHLPTRNMLDYVLVRLQGFSKLMCRIVETCQLTAHYMENKIFIGHFWKVALIAFSVVSRIWIIARSTINYCCQFYGQVLPLRNLLNNCGIVWIDTHYEFPADLNTWLNVDWINKDGVTELNPSMPRLPFYNVRDDLDIEYNGEYTVINDDVEYNGEYMEIVDDDTNDVEIINDYMSLSSPFKKHCDLLKTNKGVDGWNTVFEKDNPFSSIVQEVDVGEVVVRSETLDPKKLSKVNGGTRCDESVNKSIETPKPVQKLNKLKKRKKKNGTRKNEELSTEVIKSIDSIDTLKNFLKNEQKCRNNLEHCVSKELDKLQWNILQKLVQRHIKKADKYITCKPKVNSYLNKAKDALIISLS